MTLSQYIEQQAQIGGRIDDARTYFLLQGMHPLVLARMQDEWFSHFLSRGKTIAQLWTIANNTGRA